MDRTIEMDRTIVQIRGFKTPQERDQWGVAGVEHHILCEEAERHDVISWATDAGDPDWPSTAFFEVVRTDDGGFVVKGRLYKFELAERFPIDWEKVFSSS